MICFLENGRFVESLLFSTSSICRGLWVLRVDSTTLWSRPNIRFLPITPRVYNSPRVFMVLRHLITSCVDGERTPVSSPKGNSMWTTNVTSPLKVYRTDVAYARGLNHRESLNTQSFCLYLLASVCIHFLRLS